ncbi:hypothetical protein DQQ01_08820 [Blautia argi]|uniref:Uncharacterized protein n=1 Tax=Blautia argi TaxID=1912897 RepID=A0A2Z4UB05_9FIRM|nr:hypothetical protein DQQ01_08820 [Blautia argi]
MSASGIERSGKEIEKLVFTYLIVTLVCAGFGAVYEFFSHGVYSYYILYAFMIPFLGGTVYFYCILYFRSKIPGCIARRFQHFGILTLTVGCMVCGILEIYGTTNRLVIFYFIVGGMFLVIGNFMYLLQKN